uniref:G-protein coupled receptors family 1 profile domain-containing protein n=1 Tax=Clytia hemisphaerica TaxID=252671 RepID=A0A7M5UZB3_9CNID
MNLGLCDVGYSAIGMLILIISTLTDSTMDAPKAFCRICFIASIFTSSCLAYDRVLSVRNLFRYQHIAQKKVPILMITFSWFAALFCQMVIMIFEYAPSTFFSYRGSRIPMRFSAAFINSLIITSNSIFIVYCLLYARQVAKQELARLGGLSRYLHGETAELYFSLTRRQKLNNDITIVSIFSLATLIPPNITFLKIFIRPGDNDASLLLFNWLIGAVYCAINPFVYLRWMRKLKLCFVRDLARIRRFINAKRNGRVRPT